MSISVSPTQRVTPKLSLPSIQGWTVCVLDCVPSNKELRLVWADDDGSLSILAGQDPFSPPTFVIRYDEVALFTLAYATHEIRVCRLDDGVPDSTIDHLLVDQIWPRILAHRGELVLHAAGVSCPDGAILFVGQSGRGKSTLAASLHQQGFALLGDDAMVISVVDHDARCRAVYRSLRLFPDSIETLFEDPVQRSAVAEYTDKENVHLPPAEPSTIDQPVQAIFFLCPEVDEAIAGVRRVSPGDACMRLVENSFWLDPTDLALTAGKLEAASRLANRVPAYDLAYPRDYAKLAELHSSIFSCRDRNDRTLYPFKERKTGQR